jgi:hypothetical protein
VSGKYHDRSLRVATGQQPLESCNRTFRLPAATTLIQWVLLKRLSPQTALKVEISNRTCTKGSCVLRGGGPPFMVAGSNGPCQQFPYREPPPLTTKLNKFISHPKWHTWIPGHSKESAKLPSPSPHKRSSSPARALSLSLIAPNKLIDRGP